MVIFGFLWFSLFVLPVFFYWFFNRKRVQKNRLGLFLEKHDLWFILVPFRIIYLKFFEIGTWSKEITWVCLILSYFGLICRHLLSASLIAYIPWISPEFLTLLLQLLPLVVLNQMVVFFINSSTFVVEILLAQNKNLVSKVDGYLKMRGFIFNDDNEIKTGESLEKPKVFTNNSPKTPPTPNPRPFWNSSRTNVSRTTLYCTIFGIGISSVFAIHGINLQKEANRIARINVEATNSSTAALVRKLDKEDVADGLMSKEDYAKKWHK